MILRYVSTVVACALLAACGGGPEQEGQMENTPTSDASNSVPLIVFPEDTMKTFEEKLAEYSIENAYRNENIDADSDAPVLYSEFDTIVNDAEKTIEFHSNVILEDTLAFLKLPLSIHTYLINHDIKIPYYGRDYMDGSNMLTSEFKYEGQTDIALLGFKNDTCAIYYFWNMDTLDPTRVLPLPIDLCWNRKLYLNDSDYDFLRGEYGDYRTFRSMEASYNYYYSPSSPTPPKSFNHAGICDLIIYLEGAWYHYFENDRLISWCDYDTGWKEWQKVYSKTLQDTLLVNPFDCDGLPTEIATFLDANNRRIVVDGKNHAFIKGQFLQAEQFDYLVLTHQDTDSSNTCYQLSMLLFPGGNPDSMVTLEILTPESVDVYYRRDTASLETLRYVLENEWIEESIILNFDPKDVEPNYIDIEDTNFRPYPVDHDAIVTWSSDPFDDVIGPTFWYFQYGNLWIISEIVWD